MSGGFDAGLRLAGSVPRDMIAVAFGKPVRFLCVAAPAYLQKRRRAEDPDDLKRHRCIGHRVPNGKLYRWEFERAAQSITLDAPASVILDDEDLMVEAAVKGLGVAYVLAAGRRRALKAGNLREILAPWLQYAEGMAVYYPGHRKVPPALRAFLDVVREVGKGR